MFKKLKDERSYRKFYFQDSFHAQCADVDKLTMVQFDRSVESVSGLMRLPVFKTAKHVIGTGCGDSNLAAFAVKGAFEHYLPEVEYEAVEAIELARHYDYEGEGPGTVALFISVSGGIFRTIEALEQCKRHGITTVAITDDPSSRTAREADILYHTNTPEGDNNAGLRTYYANLISTVILAAAMAQARTGRPCLEELREHVQTYHDDFFAEFERIDDTCFATAIHWMDKKCLEVVADGPMFWAGKFVQAKVVELSGDVCAVIDSENYMHVNNLMVPGGEIGDMVIINSNDKNLPRISQCVNVMVTRDRRDVLLFCDRAPEEIGITAPVSWCRVPMPRGDFNFLAPIYAYLPGAIFAGFRHTTIGEPMFRGGMEMPIFVPTYFSPVDVPEI